jgi:hypothetical protein
MSSLPSSAFRCLQMCKPVRGRESADAFASVSRCIVHQLLLLVLSAYCFSLASLAPACRPALSVPLFTSCNHHLVPQRYQDIQAGEIPVADKDGASVRVMAGSSLGVEGPIKMRNPGLLLDVRLAAGAQLDQVRPHTPPLAGFLLAASQLSAHCLLT